MSEQDPTVVVATPVEPQPTSDDIIMGQMAATHLYHLGLMESQAGRSGLQLPSEKVDQLLSRCFMVYRRAWGQRAEELHVELVKVRAELWELQQEKGESDGH